MGSRTDPTAINNYQPTRREPEKRANEQHLQVHDIVQHCKGFFFLTFDADEMIVDLRQPLYKMQQIYKQGLAVLAKTR